MLSSTRVVVSRSEARQTSLVGSASSRSRLILVVMVSAICTSIASCRLPGDARALARAHTDLAHVVKKEFPPTTEAIRDTMSAVKTMCAAMQKDAEERKEQTRHFGKEITKMVEEFTGLLVKAGAGLLTAIGLGILYLRRKVGVETKQVRHEIGQLRNGGQVSPAPSSSSPG